MDSIKAKCSALAPEAKKGGYYQAMLKWYQKRDDDFKALQKEVFGE
jgi:hypothetical protein